MATRSRSTSCGLNPNVSFWGTINYDETTERLSPRLLDRTGMIFHKHCATWCRRN